VTWPHPEYYSGLGRHKIGDVAAEVVDPKDERAGLGVGHDADRAGVDHDALEVVEMAGEGIGEHGLDDVAVAAGQPDGARTVRCGDPGVVPADRLHGPCLHTGEPLAVGEDRGRRVRLHDPPERLLRKVLECATRPRPVVDLGQARLGDQVEPAAGEQRRDGLLAAQRW
jgi:hypothetical protein